MTEGIFDMGVTRRGRRGEIRDKGGALLPAMLMSTSLLPKSSIFKGVDGGENGGVLGKIGLMASVSCLPSNPSSKGSEVFWGIEVGMYM